MTALAITIAAAGAEQVAVTVWHVVFWIVFGVGAVILLCAAVIIVGFWFEARRLRDTEPQDEPWLRDLHDAVDCPWCDDPDVIDSSRCTCTVPCPIWLCEAPEAARG